MKLKIFCHKLHLFKDLNAESYKMKTNQKHELKPWQLKMHEIIFEADTPEGKIFDISILILILLSIVAVTLESVDIINEKYGAILRAFEWFFTILFMIEYLARIACLRQPRHYIFSFFGIVDLLSFLPSFLGLIFVGVQAFIIIRIFRLLRVFRILKLVRFLGEAQVLQSALKESVPKILVFLITVVCIATIMGTTMYIVEGPENGFKNIPTSIYWTVVTMTTVGFGDITPQTPLGKTLATMLMILGYGIIAVPTGIVTAHITRRNMQPVLSELRHRSRLPFPA